MEMIFSMVANFSMMAVKMAATLGKIVMIIPSQISKNVIIPDHSTCIYTVCTVNILSNMLTYSAFLLLLDIVNIGERSRNHNPRLVGRARR